MTKRSVTTDALDTLGTIIDDKQKRDAIHLAVEPVIAGQDLRAGNHITVRSGIAFLSTSPEDALGIVDPFLLDEVKTGQRFWFVMYPRMVTSLRHVWTHAAFPDMDVDAALAHVAAERRSESERWIRAYLDDERLDYSFIMEQARGAAEDEDYYTLSSGHSSDFRPSDEFWHHVETVLAVKFKRRPEYFACSC